MGRRCMDAHRRFTKWRYPPAEGRIEAGKPYPYSLYTTLIFQVESLFRIDTNAAWTVAIKKHLNSCGLQSLPNRP
jgi:hypothetical protein